MSRLFHAHSVTRQAMDV